MYRGFNVNISDNLNESYYEIGLKIHTSSKKEVKTILDDFLLENKSLSGTKIMENWFPEINADIFLSHSHGDEKNAITLAGKLFKEFGIKTFIDSCIWGYSNNLLRQIDDQFCMNPSGETYSYTKRNYSTSHVNLMLSTALNRMIDNCECIFFLNTPNSISANEIVSRTKSPWIFSEIATTQIIRKTTPKRLQRETRIFAKGGALNENILETLTIEYDLELSHLTEFTHSDLEKWVSTHPTSVNQALDNLYLQKPINEKFIL